MGQRTFTKEAATPLDDDRIQAARARVRRRLADLGQVTLHPVERFLHFFDEVIWQDESRLSGWRRHVYPKLRVLHLVYLNFQAHGAPTHAAALTYTSLLAIVPFIAVAFALFQAFGGLESVQASLQDLLVQYLAPGMESTMKVQLESMMVKIRTGARANAALATVLLFVTVIRTLAGLEWTFNTIFGVKKGRPWTSRIVVYWAVVSLGPVLVGASLGITASVQSSAIVAWLEDRASLAGRFAFTDDAGRVLDYNPLEERVVPGYEDDERWVGFLKVKGEPVTWEQLTFTGGVMRGREPLSDEVAVARMAERPISYRLQLRAAGTLATAATSTASFDRFWWERFHVTQPRGATETSRAREYIWVLSNLEAGDTLALHFGETVVKPVRDWNGAARSCEVDAPGSRSGGRPQSLEDGLKLAAAGHASAVLMTKAGTVKEAHVESFAPSEADVVRGFAESGAAPRRSIATLMFRWSPALFASVAFALLYLFLPNAKVKPRAALVGGLFAGVAFELAKQAFASVSKSMVASQSEVYGAIATLFVFLFWVYISWTIVLLGLEVVVATQSATSHRKEEIALSVSQRFREMVALRLVTEVCERFDQGAEPATVEGIAAALDVPERLLHDVIGILEEEGIVRRADDPEGHSAYLPARPLEKISVDDVLSALRDAGERGLAVKADEESRCLAAIVDATEAASSRVSTEETMRRVVDEVARRREATTGVPTVRESKRKRAASARLLAEAAAPREAAAPAATAVGASTGAHPGSGGDSPPPV